jgi:hypothetical protein
MLNQGYGFGDLASISQWYRAFIWYLGEIPEDVVERYGDIARRLQSACKYSGSDSATASPRCSIAVTQGLQIKMCLIASFPKLPTKTSRTRTWPRNWVEHAATKKKQSNGPDFCDAA